MAIHGLNILWTRGTSYGFVVIGWCRQDGDDVTVTGCRVIRRFGRDMSIAELAANGPKTTGEGPTQLLPASATPETYWRPHVHRVSPADAKSWAKECPRPKGWE